MIDKARSSAILHLHADRRRRSDRLWRPPTARAHVPHDPQVPPDKPPRSTSGTRRIRWRLHHGRPTATSTRTAISNPAPSSTIPTVTFATPRFYRRSAIPYSYGTARANRSTTITCALPAVTTRQAHTVVETSGALDRHGTARTCVPCPTSATRHRQADGRETLGAGSL